MRKIIWQTTLVILIVVIVLSGYRQFTLNRQLGLQIENNYQLAFIDLTTHLGTIEDELAVALASNSKENQALNMATVWRNIYAAQKSIGQLPFILTPLQETEIFLYNLGLFAQRTLTSLVNGKEEINKEKVFEYNQQVNKLNNDLQNLTRNILDENNSWLQLQQQLISTSGVPVNNSIVDGLHKIDRLVSQYPEQDILNIASVQKPSWYIHGKEISVDEALLIFQRRLSSELEDTFITKSEIFDTRGELPGYMVSLYTDNGLITGHLTKRDGKISWFIWEKNIELNHNINPLTAINNAQNFIKSISSDDLEIKELNRESNPKFYEFIFVCFENEILCYPDQFWVRVAKDDGRITGYNSLAYLLNHRQRDFGTINLTEKDALNLVSPLVKEPSVIGLALVKDQDETEKTTYEIRGIIEENSYRIFINAMTGKEELIIRNRIK